MEADTRLLWRPHFFVSIFVLGFFACARPSDQPEDIVAAYLRAPTVHDRLPFVRSTPNVKANMTAFYGGIDVRGRRQWQSIECSGKPPQAVIQCVVLFNRKVVLDVELDDSLAYVLVLEKNKYKLDWEASIGWNPLPLSAFASLHPGMPFAYRVVASLGDSHPDTAAREKFWSIHIHTEAVGDLLHAFVEKGSDAGMRLHSLLENRNKPHPLIVTMAYPSVMNEPSEEIRIQTVEQAGWIEGLDSNWPDPVSFRRASSIYVRSPVGLD
jgi:hypothetical protein